MAEQQNADSKGNQIDPIQKSLEDDKIRESGEYSRAVDYVKIMRDISYAASEHRSGPSQPREDLHDGYNALLKHMQLHPDSAAQDAALLRAFQQQASDVAFKMNLSEAERDRMLGDMLKYHASHDGPEVNQHHSDSHGHELQP